MGTGPGDGGGERKETGSFTVEEVPVKGLEGSWSTLKNKDLETL